MTDAVKVSIEELGSGPAILFLHGMDKAGAAAWAGQQELADHFRLRMVELPGFGATPGYGDQDWERDADLVASSLGPEPQHLVGHSYGGVVALALALKAPEKIASITLIEPALFGIAEDLPAAAKFVARMREIIYDPSQDRQRFVKKVVSVIQPSLRWLLFFITVPKDTVDSLWRLKAARPMNELRPTKAEVATLTFPFLLVSGGHNRAYDEVLNRLSAWTGYRVSVIRGGGHRPQSKTKKFNDLLRQFVTKHSH